MRCSSYRNCSKTRNDIQDNNNLSNNIGVDPKVVCHTERSEPTVDARRGQSQVSLFSVLLRSFTFVQDDKFTQKIKHGSTAILLP